MADWALDAAGLSPAVRIKLASDAILIGLRDLKGAGVPELRRRRDHTDFVVGAGRGALRLGTRGRGWEERREKIRSILRIYGHIKSGAAL